MAEFIDNIRIRLHHGDATTWLVLVNVAVFLAATIADLIFPSGMAREYLSLMASGMWTLTHPWTLATYMVVHFNVLHILFNMLWLWWFGRMADDLGTNVWAAYIAGGLVGGLLYLGAGMAGLFVSPGAQLVGASASVMCIMTALAFKAPDVELNLFLIGRVKLKWFALICIVLAFLGLGGGNSGGVIAHIGGVLTGVVIGLKQRGRLRLPRTISLVPGGLRTARARARMRKARPEVLSRRAAAQSSGEQTSPAQQHRRLDQLLDKIKVSGYASLSNSEKEELKRLSQNIDK